MKTKLKHEKNTAVTPKKQINRSIVKMHLISLLENDDDIKKLIARISKEESRFCLDDSNYISREQHENEIRKLKENADNEMGLLNDRLSAAKGKLSIAEAKIEDLEQKNFEVDSEKANKLKELNDKIRSIKDDHTKTVDGKNCEIKALKANLSESEKRYIALEKKYDAFEKRYAVMEECYQNYLNLSEKTKKELEGIIYAPSVGGLFACAGKNDFVKRFSEYIRKRIMSCKVINDDIRNLNNMFDTLFIVYNESEGEAKYRRDNVNIGEEYRTDKYTTIGLQQGKISDVLFYGYYKIDDPSEYFKSIVEVSE